MVELLEAAAEIIAEVGYEAATMTAIAERAGASIGAVYQYFPNKEAVVRALRSQYGMEMEARWAPLTREAERLSTEELVDRIFVVLTDFIDFRPAFVALLSAPLSYSRDPAARIRLREHFAELFRKRNSALTPAEAFRVANVTMQIVKGLNPLYAEAKPRERQEVLREFKLALSAYLIARLAAREG
ncbi:MAG: TetR/AcrR family transcriptional regulator [Janthinobacterium lividum]